ncbi:unnamed protein product [Dibothriocephalus latus]|uniref:Uncharacterized protein n=1 Tax=Dibothriocephalus latus TaxID=60516 RepID=A0A3P7R7G2_DIBLA|nr:unnamed protein product [Dibothriocephalus latus]
MGSAANSLMDRQDVLVTEASCDAHYWADYCISPPAEGFKYNLAGDHEISAHETPDYDAAVETLRLHLRNAFYSTALDTLGPHFVSVRTELTITTQKFTICLTAISMR